MYDDVASVVLLCYLFIIALAILFSEGTFVAALLCSMFSLIIASTYMVMGAIDVAITEAIVGAGVSTIFFLNAINKVGKSRRIKRSYFHLTISMVIMVVTCFALLFSIMDMPKYGDIKGPAHNHIYEFYISTVRDRFHFVDVVTAVLASIRGYDTLGETTVVMLAAVSVILIMGLGNEKT